MYYRVVDGVYVDTATYAAQWPMREVEKYSRLADKGIVTREELLDKIAELRAKYGVEMYDKDLEEKKRAERKEEDDRLQLENTRTRNIERAAIESERARFLRMSRLRRFFYKGD